MKIKDFHGGSVVWGVGGSVGLRPTCAIRRLGQ